MFFGLSLFILSALFAWPRELVKVGVVEELGEVVSADLSHDVRVFWEQP